MEAVVVRFTERYLVWLVALLASLEAFGQATQGAVDGRTDHVVLWVAITAAIWAGTAALEMVKARSGAWMGVMFLFEGEPEVVLARVMTLGVAVAAVVLLILVLVLA